MTENPLISRKNIKNSSFLSGILVILLLLTSLAGILRPEKLYASAELRAAFLPNDVVNLALGIPFLILFMLQAGRGKPIAQLLWPGVVLFVTYNALAYAVALTGSPFFGLYLLELALSLGIFFILFRAIDAAAVAARVVGKVHEKLVGWVLLGLGLLILFRNIGVVVGSAGMARSEIGVMAADLLSIAAWMSAGIWMVGRKTAGYRMGPAALFQASLLFLSLIVVMAIQPLFGVGVYGAVDFAVIAFMSLVCWVPFFLQLQALRRALGTEEIESR